MRLPIPILLGLSAAIAGATLAAALGAGAAEVPTPPATPVAPLTVSPEAPARGRVVASTEAAPLAAPDFTAKDAAPRPMAVKIAPNAAVGRQTVETAAPPGLLGNNPGLSAQPKHVDVGVTALF